MKSVRLDSTRSSVSSLGCFPIQAGKTARRDWARGKQIVLVKLNTGDERHLTPVRFYYNNKFRVGLMDCITGSLYSNDRCLSSAHLRISEVISEDGADSLVNKKVVDWRTKQW